MILNIQNHLLHLYHLNNHNDFRLKGLKFDLLLSSGFIVMIGPLVFDYDYMGKQINLRPIDC